MPKDASLPAGGGTAKPECKHAELAADVVEAKLRFLKAAGQIQPLGFIRKKPLISVGCAMLLGFGLSNLRKSHTALPLINLALEANGILRSLIEKK